MVPAHAYTLLMTPEDEIEMEVTGELSLFECQALHCRLTRRACLARQEARVRKPNTEDDRRPLSMAMCDPELCEQGAAVRRELGEAAVRDVRKPTRKAWELRVYPKRKRAAPGAEVAPPSPPTRPGVLPLEKPAPERPARKEETVVTKTCRKCGHPLRSDNRKGICGAPGDCRRRAEARSGGEPAESPVAVRTAHRRRAAEPKQLPVHDLACWNDEDLLLLHEQLRAELQLRIDAKAALERALAGTTAA